MSGPTPTEVVKAYLERGFRIVTWPQLGDVKGPTQRDWQKKQYAFEDYREGNRVGLMTGVQVSEGRYLHDVDIDWAAGASVAIAMLPSTGMVYGRQSKKISHCLYTSSEPLPSYKYEDVDKVTLIELRGTKLDGSIGYQSMAPPSIWSKGNQREPLTFVRSDAPSHVEPSTLKQQVCLAAIGMILAKRFGHNGFGHDARLAWAGFLLRASIPVEDLVKMGEAISALCNNKEVADVRRAVESTAAALAVEGKKVKGGPALARMLGTDGKLIVSKINDWLGRESDFVRVDGKIVKDHQGNIRRAVELLGKTLSYNQFNDKILIDSTPLDDRQMTLLWLKIDEEFHFRPTYAFFEKVVSQAAWDAPFHPVKEYLSTLTWDQRPRIDEWLIRSAGVADSPYVRAVSAIVLIAAVRRIFKPGSKYDEMVILEGAQGLHKSSALRALCPHGDWFSDDLPLNTSSQKVIEATLGKWIIEASELAGKRKAEDEHLKSMLSRQIDGPARMAYAHMPVERPRQFIIVGTTNSAYYMKDSTGARRFWPMKIVNFDVSWIEANRDQLWAEAKHREQQGESIRLHESLWPAAAVQQERRREVDPWEHAIRGALLVVIPATDGKRRISVDDLWTSLNIPVERRDRVGGSRISEIMHRFGFKRASVRVNGEVTSGFITDVIGQLEVEEEPDGDADGAAQSEGAEPPF